MHDLSIHKIQQLYETKKASPVEVTEYCLQQIEQFHNLHAFITVTAEEALLQAKLTEQKMMTNNPLGKLEGIPIGWKDNIHTANIKTTSGSIVDEQFIPMKNASIVDHLLGQGAITLGKQNMHEFAFGITSNNPFYGPVKNPWDTSITAAGSSGGSAAAVAMDMGVASIGTDTGGSIRIPAAACGVVGLKPTYGLLKGDGVTNISWTLDHVGPITKDVTDAALMLDALMLTDTYSASLHEDIRGLRIGVAKNYFYDNVDPVILDIFHKSLQKLVDLGAILIEVTIPCERSTLQNNFIIATAESNYVHRDRIKQSSELYGEDVGEILRSGKHISSLLYLEALHQIRETKTAFTNMFEEIDVLATPTTAVLPQKIGKNTVNVHGEEKDLFAETTSIGAVFNVTGHPAISIPTGEFVDRIPVGIHFASKAYHEAVLLHVAYAYERAYVQDFYKKRAKLGGKQ